MLHAFGDSRYDAVAYDAVAYDDHGNSVQLGDQQMTYDASDRHIATTSSGTTPATSVVYRRDPLDRIVERTQGVGFRSASSAAADVASDALTIPTPSGVVEGDVMVMHVAATGGEVTDLTPPTGWTAVAATSNLVAAQSAVWWKTAGASEPGSYTVTLSVPLQASGGIAAYSGVHATDPIADSSEATATAADAVTVPGVSGIEGSRVVGLYAYTLGGLSVPPMQTERFNASTDPVAITSAGADEPVTVSGPSGPRTATADLPGFFVAHLLALRPAEDPAVIRYGHTGHADAPAFQQTRSGAVTERMIALPGGVMLTMTGTTPSSADVWSYPNLHGDVAATADGQGAKVGPTFTYDPFGQPLAGDPENTGSDFSYGWVGSESKLTERAGDIRTVQMGARQYVPGLGRFLSVDPIEGGCANDYVYVFGDPVNQKDLDGQGVWDSLKCNGAAAAGVIVGGVAIVAAVADLPVLAGAAAVAGIGLSVYGGVQAARRQDWRGVGLAVGGALLSMIPPIGALRTGYMSAKYSKEIGAVAGYVGARAALVSGPPDRKC